MTDWNKLKVVDLRNELKRRGLPQNGLKLDLVNRLTAAENEAGSESEATVQGDVGKDAAGSTSPETAELAHSSPVDAVESRAEPVQSESEIHHPPPSAPEAIAPTQSTTQPAATIESSENTSSEEPRSSLPSVGLAEAVEDRQKRKRRSFTPPPSAADISRKRARPSDESVMFQEDVSTTKEDKDGAEKYNAADGAQIHAEVKEATSSQPGPSTKDDAMDGAEVAGVHAAKYEILDSPSRTKDSRYRDLVQAQNSPYSRDDNKTEMVIDAEPDRVISPAIHPATSALYIRDLMRPLNQIILKDHLAKLASPPGQAPDPGMIVGFYLDPIRTHCFVSFTSVSAASRVRSAIHDRVWPDESNRKPLWADFIPSEKVEEWSAEEKDFGDGGRSSMKKWEVYYDTDDDRRVTAILQEATGRSIPKPMRKPSMQAKQVSVHSDRLGYVPRASEPGPPIQPDRLGYTPRAGESTPPVHPDRLTFAPGTSPPAAAPSVHPDRLAFVPSATPPAGSGSQSYRGLEGVPSGPRATQNREQRAAQNISQLDNLFKSTTAQPKLYWQPVSRELANARLDGLEYATTKDVSRHVGGEINRYTFEDGDVLVDRGPEIFPGIRPPRRERRGPPPVRSGRDRGGGGGYGGNFRGRGYEGRGGYGVGYEARAYESRGYEGRGGFDRGYDSYRGDMRDSRDSRDSRDRRY